MQRRKLATLMAANFFGTVPAAPSDVSDLAGAANLDGTISLTFSLPAGANFVRIRYNVDQAAAPSSHDQGIQLEDSSDGTVEFTTPAYGASYKFSAFAHGDGGWGSGVDSVTVVGPFNPNIYADGLNFWMDARRETPQTDDTDINATDWTGTQTVSDGPFVPHYRTSGINSLPTIEGRTAAEATNKGYQLGDVDLHGAGGLSVAALLESNDTGSSAVTIASKDDNAPLASWTVKKSNTSHQIIVSADGTALVSATGTSTDDTDPHGMVAVYEPSTRLAIYADGAEEGLNVTSIPAALYDNSPEESRIMLARSNSGDPWRGQMTIQLIYPTALSKLAGELLSADLADIGGV